MTTRVPPKEISGLYGALVKRFATKMFGSVPTSIGVLWHHLPALKASMAYGQKLKSWHECDEGLKSFAHMAVAAKLGCSWCLDYNYFEASNHGLDMEKAREVPRWRESEIFTILERQVMDYAEQMSQTPPAVEDQLSAELLDQLGPAGLLELTAVIGFANLTTRSNIALGIESEGFADACGLAPLAVASPA